MEAERLRSRRPAARASSRSAACSSAKVPTTLVWMNSPGPSIERSTWLSAARCMTTSGAKLSNSLAHLRRVRDVGAHEGVARIVRHGRERVEIARIGELVDDQHLMRRVADEVAHHRRADEAGAAGDEDTLRHHAPSYLNGDAKSAKRPSFWSLSDSTASLAATGQSIASVGSFQMRPLSLAGA